MTENEFYLKMRDDLDDSIRKLSIALSKAYKLRHEVERLLTENTPNSPLL